MTEYTPKQALARGILILLGFGVFYACPWVILMVLIFAIVGWAVANL